MEDNESKGACGGDYITIFTSIKKIKDVKLRTINLWITDNNRRSIFGDL